MEYDELAVFSAGAFTALAAMSSLGIILSARSLSLRLFQKLVFAGIIIYPCRYTLPLDSLYSRLRESISRNRLPLAASAAVLTYLEASILLSTRPLSGYYALASFTISSSFAGAESIFTEIFGRVLAESVYHFSRLYLLFVLLASLAIPLYNAAGELK